MTTETAIPSFLGAAVQRREDPALITALSGNVPDGVTPGLDEEIHLKSGGLNFPSGCHLAVVDIDPESGSPRLDRMWAVDDAGNIVNPMLAHGQRHRGLGQGVCQALWEKVIYDEDGNLVTSSFHGLSDSDRGISFVVWSCWDCHPDADESPWSQRAGRGRGNWLNTRGGQRCRRPLGGADVQTPVTSEQIWRILHS